MHLHDILVGRQLGFIAECLDIEIYRLLVVGGDILSRHFGGRVLEPL